ncbi:hypothetical protein SETIT_3G395900v2 [Setaria italica]|uniref:Uncharacterized protein n=1 Tax=Setaria italica TaxID=4555 RepID=A0A368QNK9_SETIT|nr:hypothetical protein SETIT_3G395900v2 [Setaria italica]
MDADARRHHRPPWAVVLVSDPFLLARAWGGPRWRRKARSVRSAMAETLQPRQPGPEAPNPKPLPYRRPLTGDLTPRPRPVPGPPAVKPLPPGRWRPRRRAAPQPTSAAGLPAPPSTPFLRSGANEAPRQPHARRP